MLNIKKDLISQLKEMNTKAEKMVSRMAVRTVLNTVLAVFTVQAFSILGVLLASHIYLSLACLFMNNCGSLLFLLLCYIIYIILYCFY